MDFIEKMVEQFLKLNRKMKRWQRAVSILGAVVVFASTYMLVLPAITLDKDTASTQAGIEVAASENDPSEDGTVYEAEAEEAEAEEEAAEDEEEASGTDSGSNEAEAAEEEAAPAEEEVSEEPAAEEPAASEDAEVSEDAPVAGEAAEPETADEAATEDAAEAATDEAVIDDGLIKEDTQLVYEGEGYTVYADFGAAAKLPEGVGLQVKEITAENDPEVYQAYYDKALSEVRNEYDDFTKLSFAKFYDISFVKDGAEVEPSGDVKVRIEYDETLDIAEDTAVDTIHFDKDDEEKAEVILTEIDSEKNGDEEAVKAVEFESDKFSVYGVVGTQTIETQVITADGDTYKISVSYGPEAGIPVDAWLTAVEIKKGTAEYEEYFAQAKDALGIEDNNAEASVPEAPVVAADEEIDLENAVNPFNLPLIEEGEYEEEDVFKGMVFKVAEDAYQDDISFARFFDIKIMTEEGEVEPKEPVEVKIEYVDPVQVSEEEALKAVHFGKDETEVTDIEAGSGAVSEMIFTQGSFSVTGTVVTTGSNWPTSGQQYVMYFTNDNGSYAIRRDGSEIPVNVANGRLTFPTATSVNDIAEFMWTYNGGWGNNTVSQQTSSGTVYLDPTSNIGTSTNSTNLTRNNGGRVSATLNDVTYYIGSNNDHITNLPADQAGDAVQIQFANAFAVDPHVTVHFVDRNGNALTDVEYNGQNPGVVKDTDENSANYGSFTIPYNWRGTDGSIKLSDEFKKDGYTYASTHLAGHSNAKNRDLTYDGITIDAELQERSGVLYFYSDNGHGGGNEGNTVAYGNLIEYNMNGALQTRTTTNGTLENYAAEGNKEIYVILDPAGPGGTGPSGSDTAPDVEDPTFKKEMTPNVDATTGQPDGTYNLALSVTGKATSTTTKPKTNVVLVVDTSSSMDQYHTGPNNTGNTRLQDVQEALKEIGATLLGNNTSADPDTVELAMVSFDGEADYDLRWTTNLNSFNDAVDALDVHRGTDWEDGLKLGYQVASEKQAGEPGESTYVIFFTDGEGSQYTNFNGRSNWDGHDTTAGYGYWYSYFLCRESAKDEMRAMVRDGIRLYSIYAYNSSASDYKGEKGEDLLHNCVKYGYDTQESLQGDRFFHARSTEDLQEAFTKIARDINSSVGFTEIEMNDSITELTSVGISLMGSSATGFRYTRSGGSYGAGTPWIYAPRATYDKTTGVQWKLDKDLNGDPIILEDGVTYTVNFTVWPSQVAYDWVSDLNNGFRTWYEAQVAGVDRQILRIETGPDQYRYELKSNPDSYDSEGNLVDNIITYKKISTQTMIELPDGVELDKEYPDPNNPDIITVYTDNGDGTYTRTVTTPKKTAFGPPDKNMPLEDTHIMVEKEWVVGLDDSQLVEFLYNVDTAESKYVKVEFDIIQLDRTDHPYDNPYNVIYLGWQGDAATGYYDWSDATHPVTVNGNTYDIGTKWDEEMDIAVGVILDEEKFLEHGLDPADPKYRQVVFNNKTYFILETGHPYIIDEPQQIIDDFRFDFETQEYHPMLVNGVLKNVTFDANGGITSIVPEVDVEPLSSFLGKNILRGEINLKKLLLDQFGNDITGDKIPDDEFEFTLTVNNVNENALSGVDTLYYIVIPNGMTIADGKAYHDDDGTYLTKQEAQDKWGDQYEAHRNDLTPNSNGTSASATFSITGKEYVKIIDVPAGSTYSFTETVHTDYVFVEANRDDSGQKAKVEAPDDPEIGGHIVPNKASYVDFTNKQKPSYQVKILKLDQDGKPLAGAKFDLYTKEEWEKDEADPTRTALLTGVESASGTGLIDLGMLKRGVYYLEETDVPDGYILMPNPVEITVDPDSTQKKLVNGVELPLYVTYKQDGNAASQDNSGISIEVDDSTNPPTYIYTLSVINQAHVELPYTGGPGSFIYTLSGMMMIIAAAMMYGFRMRRRERRSN